jgi:hypothetical protein
MPDLAQVSNITGMVVDDFNADGNLDVVLCGNDYGTEISVGRYDALNGLLLRGDGKGGFKVMTIAESGIYIPGNAKAMVKLLSANNSYNIVASQNRDKLRIARLNIGHDIIKPQTNENSALVTFKNGKKQKVEFPYGSSFLSQSSRFMMLSPDVSSVLFIATDGKKRVVKK